LVIKPIIEGSLEVKLPTIWADGKAQVGRVREEKRREEKRREEKKIEDQRRERVRRKKMQARKKGRKVAQLCVFPMICGSGGSKSRLAKAAGAEPSGQMREAYFQVQMYKTPHVRTTFGS